MPLDAGPRPRVAVIGGGNAGMVALCEAAACLGGHARTVIGLALSGHRRLVASGVIYGPTGRVATGYTATMMGTWDSTGGTLNESFRSIAGGTQDRAWRLTAPGADDVSRHWPGDGFRRHRSPSATRCGCPSMPAAGGST